MITHAAETRGNANHGWLNSHHTFSFAHYYNPERMGFGMLRVINDDVVIGGAGFGTHPHRDMEIISIPLKGTLAHKDSEGNAYEIKKGEVQIMSAGTGIAHSEFNASETDEVNFLQIWIIPKRLGIKPRYEQKFFEKKRNELKLVVSPEGNDGSLEINQDAFFSLGEFDQGKTFDYELKQKGHGLYAFVIKGEVSVNGQTMKARDGVGITDLDKVTFKADSDLEILLMEVPMKGAGV